MEPANELVPDIGNPPKVRKKRAPKHDFKDGNGKVFAHRHDNGGGWVADTAYVAPTVEVKRNAQVFGFARVVDDCRLENYAQVCDRARLYNSVVVKDRARVCGNASVCDTTRVSGKACVTNFADLSGGTHVHGNVVVQDCVKLINTTCCNDAVYRRQRLAGRAIAIDSQLYEIVDLRDTPVLQNTVLRNVMVSSSSRLTYATIHTQLNFDTHQRLYAKDFSLEHPLHTCVVHCFNAYILNSRLFLPPTVIARTAMFVDCDIDLAPDDLPLDLFRPTDKVYYMRNSANRSTDLFGLSEIALENIRNNRPANPNSQPSVSPILTAGSQRRILRLESGT